MFNILYIIIYTVKLYCYIPFSSYLYNYLIFFFFKTEIFAIGINNKITFIKNWNNYKLHEIQHIILALLYVY